MQPVGTPGNRGADSASDQDTLMIESRSRQILNKLFGGAKRVSGPIYPPSSQASSHPLLDAGPDSTPTLEKRTIGHQPSESSSAGGGPGKLDLTLFGKKSGYDFFAAELPKLGPASRVGVGMCGRTFTCETSSWGIAEMSLTFTGCDLQGNPKPVNEIGVQLLDTYPDDWQQNRSFPPLEEIAQTHLRSIASFVKDNDYSLQFDQLDPTEHVLMLGALNEGTTYRMNLRVKPCFPSGLPVPPGVTPRALLAFVTTESLERSIWLGGSPSFPVASTAINLSDSEQGEIVRAGNRQGGLVNQSNIQARPEDCPRPQVKLESPSGEHPLSREFHSAARVLVTPAIAFNAPPVRGSFSRREDVFGMAHALSCPGVGFTRLRKVRPPDTVRLLPTVAIGVVATDPLAGISCTPTPQEASF